LDDSRDPDGTDGPDRCLNCGAPLAGPYCHQCGQEAGGHLVSFKTLVAEATNEIFSFDSRFFRSLRPLLFRPGFLTREYMAGRRARYIPPFRFYLIVSVVFFAALALNHSRIVQVGVDETAAPDSMGVHSVPGSVVPGQTAPPDSSARQAAIDSLATTSGFPTNLLAKAASDEDRLNRDVRKTLPRLMFVLIPLFALVLKGLYARSGRLYMEHFVFALHLHTFAFLLFAVGMLVGLVAGTRAGDVFEGVAMLLVAVYLFKAMRRVYAQTVPKTLLKLVGLGFGYLLIFGAAMMVTVGITVALW
jgi:hypothetical protein